MNQHLAALLKVAGLTAAMSFLGAFSLDHFPASMAELYPVLKTAIWSAIVAERALAIAVSTSAMPGAQQAAAAPAQAPVVGFVASQPPVQK